MNRNTILFILLGVIAGFVAGFVLANKLNGSEIAALRAQGGQSNTANSNSAANQTSNSDTLGTDEVKSKIAEADRNPTNFAFQKDLGISLYTYAASKRDPDLIAEALRILTRANSLDAKDFDVLVALGNAHFDTGFYKRDLKSFETARETYAKALAIKPGDADVKTDIGISYFVQEPQDLAKAVAELNEVVAANPKQDRAMQFLLQVYLKQGKIADAEKMLAKIIDINPSNPAIAEMRTLISDAKSGQK